MDKFFGQNTIVSNADTVVSNLWYCSFKPVILLFQTCDTVVSGADSNEFVAKISVSCADKTCHGANTIIFDAESKHREIEQKFKRFIWIWCWFFWLSNQHYRRAIWKRKKEERKKSRSSVLTIVVRTNAYVSLWILQLNIDIVLYRMSLLQTEQVYMYTSRCTAITWSLQFAKVSWTKPTFQHKKSSIWQI